MTDLAENPEVPSSGKSFIYDNVAPTSYVQYPDEGTYAQINDSTATFTIYGTAEDSYSNVSKIELAIKKGVGDLYWDGGTWQSVSEYWVEADLWTSSWSYTGVNCGDGFDHRIWVKKYDDALPSNNVNTPSVGVNGTEDVKFKYDVTEPQSDVAYPGKGAAYDIQIQTFTGTYSDPNFGSGVSQVKVEIKRASDGSYWVGESPYWSAKTPLATSLITATTFEFYVSDLSYFYENTEEKYFIYTKAKDYAGNYEDGEMNWTVLRSTFIYDTVVPSVVISTPTHLGYYNSLTEIGGTSSDAFSGMNFVEVRISTNSTYFWTGSSWTTTSHWLSATGTSNWNYTNIPNWSDGTIYKIEAKAWDKAGNYKLAIATFTFDISSPTANVSIPPQTDPHYTSETLPASFSGTSTDTAPGVPQKIYVALYNISAGKWFSGSGWVGGKVWLENASGVETWNWPTSNITSWVDPTVEQKHVFYAKAEDKAGNIQDDVVASSATFWFRGNLPLSGITKPKEGNYYNWQSNGLLAIEGTSKYTAEVEIRIQRQTDLMCWDESADVWKSSTTFQWNVISGLDRTGDTWSLVISTTAWTDGVSYKVTSRGYDATMGYEADWDIKAETNKNFTIDATAPQTQVSAPQNGAYIRELPEITGPATDTGAGIRQVLITFKDATTNKYWDVPSSTWTSSVVWSTTTYSGGTWSFTNIPTLTHAHQYQVQPKATDDINEGLGSFNEFIGNQVSFTYDIVAPTAVITSPTDASYPSQLSMIKGTQADEFVINKVFLEIKNKNTTTYWDGGWYTSEKWAEVNVWPSSWTYTNVPSWTNAVSYEMKAKAWDGAGSTSTIQTINIVFDNTEPDSGITQPSPSDPYVDDIVSIGGTAKDDVSGISDGCVKNQIIDLTLPSTGYYNGGGWQADSFWLDTSGSSPWSQDYILPNWESGNKYRIISKSTPASFDVVYDTVPPVSRVTYPAKNSREKSVTEIRGTCWDDWSSVQNDWGTYPLELEITALKNAAAGWNDDEYWTGTSWSTSTAVVYPDVYKDSWTYTFSAALDSGRNYKLTPTIYDKVPNAQVDISSNTFLFDSDAPQCAVTYPSGNLNTAPSEIKGTAQDYPLAPKDNSAVSIVQIKIQDLEYSTTFWNGTNWVASETWFTIASTTWSYTVPDPSNTWTDGHQYKIWCRAVDGAGNSYESAFVTFIYDITEPETGVSVPVDDGYYASGTPSQLQGSAFDPGYPSLGTDVNNVKVRIKRYSDGFEYNPTLSPYWRDPGVDGTQWLDAVYDSDNDSWSYDIPSSSWPWENGKKYAVWSRAEDNAGNYKVSPSSAVFVYDTTQPGASVVFPGDGSFLNYSPTLVLFSSDTSPGIIQEAVVRIYREDNKYWDSAADQWKDASLGEVWNTATKISDWQEGGIYKSSWSWSGSGSFTWGDGIEYKVAVKCKDNAGNWSVVSTSHTFKTDYSSGTSRVALPIDTKYYKTLTQLQGTAYDEPQTANPSGISNTGIKVRIYDVDANKYWWGAVDHWNMVLGISLR